MCSLGHMCKRALLGRCQARRSDDYGNTRNEQMPQITIPLDDDSARRLWELAQQRGESVEQTAQKLLRSTLRLAVLPSRPTNGLPPSDPDGSQMILLLAGTIAWPVVGESVNTTNEEIDRLLAEEAINPHDDA